MLTRTAMLWLSAVKLLHADDSVSVNARRECSNKRYKSISFIAVEADNVPLPESPSQMYLEFNWDGEDRFGEAPLNKSALWQKTSTMSVGSDRNVDWEDDGWFKWLEPCGEDRVWFQLWEEDDNDDMDDDLLWEYESRTTIEEYYTLAAETKSCWYVRYGSEDRTVDGVSLDSRMVYFKWCAQVKCDKDHSCYSNTSHITWIAVMTIFVFPTALCFMCFCGLSVRRCVASCHRDCVMGHNPDALRRPRGHDRQGRPLRRQRVHPPHPPGDGSYMGDAMQRLRHFLSVRLGQQVAQHGDLVDEVDAVPERPAIQRVKAVKLSDLRKSQSRARSRGGERDASAGIELTALGSKRDGSKRWSWQGVAESDDDQTMVDDQTMLEVTCAICLLDVQPSEKVKQLPPCGHLFHGDCIDLWGSQSSLCPLCKADVSASMDEG